MVTYPLERPGLAISGHFVLRYLSFGRFRVVLDWTHRTRYRVVNATEHQNTINARDNTRRPVAGDVACRRPAASCLNGRGARSVASRHDVRT